MQEQYPQWAVCGGIQIYLVVWRLFVVGDNPRMAARILIEISARSANPPNMSRPSLFNHATQKHHPELSTRVQRRRRLRAVSGNSRGRWDRSEDFGCAVARRIETPPYAKGRGSP
jgi:hypothetical protein